MKRQHILIYGIIGAFVIAGVSFFGGMQYGKHHSAKTAVMRNGFGAQGGAGGAGFRRGGGGTIGTVTANDGTTITITDRQNASVKISLSGSPTITASDGSTAAASDIKTGDRIIATGSAGSDGTIAAKTIRINPAFGGGGQGAQGQTQSDTTQDNSAE